MVAAVNDASCRCQSMDLHPSLPFSYIGWYYIVATKILDTCTCAAKQEEGTKMTLLQ